MYRCYDCVKSHECMNKGDCKFLKTKLTDPVCDRFQPKGVTIMETKKTNAKKAATKKPAKKVVKEQTVVLTIQATYILKDGQLINPDFAKAPDKFPLNTIDMNVCPGADKVDVKKIQVFEREE